MQVSVSAEKYTIDLCVYDKKKDIYLDGAYSGLGPVHAAAAANSDFI